MPVFITQRRFTQDAMKGMPGRPEDRAEAVRQLLEKSGGKLIGYYMTFGEYNFLIVSEGPDNMMAVPFIVAAAAGGVTDLKTERSMTSDEMKAAFGKAGQIGGDFHSAGTR
jgi:uncharacterized protein with GYD domain